MADRMSEGGVALDRVRDPMVSSVESSKLNIESFARIVELAYRIQQAFDNVLPLKIGNCTVTRGSSSKCCRSRILFFCTCNKDKRANGGALRTLPG